MPMIARNILKSLDKTKKSCVLLGPRQTGKSTLMRSLRPDLEFNLMNERTFYEFSRNPSELEERLAALPSAKVIFIDEIQRLPSIFNTIQTILDEVGNKRRFLLTGSSARKLRRGQANLLPGRVHLYHLGPVVASELDYQMDPIKAMAYGTLPGIYEEESNSERAKTLSSYAAIYLREEVQAEALTRNIEGFTRFLEIAALTSGEFLDLSKLGSEVGLSPQTAKRHFDILQDTLIVNTAEAFSHSDRRRLVKHPKYFFFDTGVMNAVLDNFKVSPDRKGRIFENLLFNQILHSARSQDVPIRISSYRTSHGAEVDLIVEVRSVVWAIEVKASSNVSKSDLSGIASFRDYYGKKFRPVVAYSGSVPKVIEGVDVLPWQQLLREMDL